ncbi:LAMI_0G13784g1_1 [Lachancea mirantina]|uniref:Phosphatidylinositol transfer protein SFH5 n=1 Tax=Lachancea mirantina TaxID=1230905 RepID=A0A1G4KBV1_9SACH|nr:LAMI_0G13784g1_1 [Lachancea mirantina]
MEFANDNERQVFEKVLKELPSIVEKCQGYDELYGYKLLPGELYDEKVVEVLIYKFCKAYKFDHDQTVMTLSATLEWRRKFDPISAAFREKHDDALEAVGVLTRDSDAPANLKVITWNLYGGLLKNKEVFSDAQKFLRYRIGLMERGLRLLDFADPTNNSMTQVHDYDGVSIWRMDPQIKKCTKEVINVFQSYYPELLHAKYFINVPSLLTWVYDVVKTFVSEETRKKFVVLNDGKKLGQYVPSAPSAEYGGKSKSSLKELNVKEIKPSEYDIYMLEKTVNAEIE